MEKLEREAQLKRLYCDDFYKLKEEAVNLKKDEGMTLREFVRMGCKCTG